jgi:hypothetical protein
MEVRFDRLGRLRARCCRSGVSETERYLFQELVVHGYFVLDLRFGLVPLLGYVGYFLRLSLLRYVFYDEIQFL